MPPRPGRGFGMSPLSARDERHGRGGSNNPPVDRGSGIASALGSARFHTFSLRAWGLCPPSVSAGRLLVVRRYSRLTSETRKRCVKGGSTSRCLRVAFVWRAEDGAASPAARSLRSTVLGTLRGSRSSSFGYRAVATDSTAGDQRHMSRSHGAKRGPRPRVGMSRKERQDPAALAAYVIAPRPLVEVDLERGIPTIRAVCRHLLCLEEADGHRAHRRDERKVRRRPVRGGPSDTQAVRTGPSEPESSSKPLHQSA